MKAGLNGEAPHRKPGRICGSDERPPRSADTDDAMHGVIDLLEGGLLGIVYHGPFAPEPMLSLFDGGKFLNVTFGGDNEMQGLSPMDFNHVTHMGALAPQSNPARVAA